MPETTEPTTEAAETTEQQGEPAESLGEGGKKALEAERTARATAEKTAKELQQQLDALNRANETAIEKAQREAKEAAEQAATASLDAFRTAAVKFGGISAEDADLFLTGTDVATLEKQAARLAERAPKSPIPDPTQGGKGGVKGGSTAEQFAAAVESAFSS